MVKVKKILLLVDGSENSIQAKEYAAYLAEVTKSSVDILHVVNLGAEYAALNPVAGGYVPEELTEDLKENGEAVLREAKIGFAIDTQVRTQLGFGAPTEVAISFCEEHKPDLLIMGSRGMGTLKGLVLGSVSGYLTSHAPCPVLVVK